MPTLVDSGHHSLILGCSNFYYISVMVLIIYKGTPLNEVPPLGQHPGYVLCYTLYGFCKVSNMLH